MADEANVEQGFNDNELADIMDEIEDLEKEFIGNQDPLVAETKEEKVNQSKSPAPKQDISNEIESDIESLDKIDKTDQEELVIDTPVLELENELNKIEKNLLNKEIEDPSLDTMSEVEEIVEQEKTPPMATKKKEIAPSKNKSKLQLFQEDRPAKTEAQKAADSVLDEEVAETTNDKKEKSSPCYYTAPEKNENGLKNNLKSPLNLPVNSSPLENKTSMSFNVSGEMAINLKFHIGHQELTLEVNPKEGLVISLSTGVRLTLPIN